MNIKHHIYSRNVPLHTIFSPLLLERKYTISFYCTMSFPVIACCLDFITDHTRTHFKCAPLNAAHHKICYCCLMPVTGSTITLPGQLDTISKESTFLSKHH